MKKTLLILMFSSLFFVLSAQKEDQFFDHLVKQELDMADNYFGNSVDVCIGDFEKLLNKSEAGAKVSSYFMDNPAITYTVKHKGSSRENLSSYFVVDLRAKNGPLRMFVYFDKKPNNPRISEIRIESR